MPRVFSAAIAIALFSVSSFAIAQGAPDSLSFQGFVTDPGGVPINNPSVSMTFKLYEGATEIWAETQPTVKIVGASSTFDLAP